MQLKTKIKVVIAEDECAIMHAIANKIEEFDSDFSVVSQVSNGADALDAIQKLRPDVLFTDIKMPLMDGIELTQQVKLQYPNTRIVIISGYSDFSYTQQAIRHGVLSYLLKPVENDALRDVLYDLKSQIVREQYYSTHKIIYSSNYASRSDQPLKYCILCICVGNLLYDASDPFFQNEYSQKPLPNWEAIILELFPHAKDWYISEDALNLFTLCIRGSTFWANEISSFVSSLHSRLLSVYHPFPISIAYFQQAQAQEDIWMCGNRLQRLLQQHIIPAQSSIFMIEQDEYTQTAESFSIVKTRVNNQLRTLISEKNKQGIQQELSLIFNYMVNHQVKQHDFQKVILYIIRTCEFNGLPVDESCVKRIMRHLCVCFDKSKLAETLVRAILQTFWPEDATADLGVQLLNYVDNHYLQLDQLEDLSLIFHYSYSYLSRLFKKHTGVPLNKYVIEKKLELAKQLIENNRDLSIAQIAELSGFSDRRNFLRAFSSYTKMSPSEYKASIISKG